MKLKKRMVMLFMQTERVDDLPLLISEFEKSDLSGLLNEYFPDHGNWSGLSGGKVAVGFLTYLLSCSDHRLHRVEPWAGERLHTLGHCLGCKELSAKDFTDDRLGALLDRFSDEEKWDSFEKAHNTKMLHVYQLNTKSEAIRLDAMIVQSFRDQGENFKQGHSKQHRADLPQLKVMVATLDPLSMPLSSVIVPGNKADDQLYLEVVKKLEVGLDLKGQLFVGDAKLGSLSNRSYLQNEGQYYLSPLSKKQCSPAQLSAYLADQPKELVAVFDTPKKLNSPLSLKAKAFETTADMHDRALDIRWTERRLVVYSASYADSLRRKLDERIDRVASELDHLLESKQGKKKLKTQAEIESAVEQLLKKHKVQPFFEVQVLQEIQTTLIRKYGQRPAGIKEDLSFSLQVQINHQALEKHQQTLGWRVYATNAPLQRLSTKEAIICYRQEYRIEHKFNELLNKFTQLVPVYLQKDNRIKALVQLSLLALKFVSTIEHQVRKELQEASQKIKNLYHANPNRATDKPTTKMILEAFQNITLVILPQNDQTIVQITQLNHTQRHLLKLLRIDQNIYENISQFFFSKRNLGET
jgi:transposase